MRLLVARRFHKDGRPDIVVDAFDMGTSEDAFGVFTHDLDGENAGIGQGSTYKAGLLSFWKDRFFVSVYAEEETADTREAVLDLGRRIAAAIPARGEPPDLLLFHTHSVLNYHYFVADTNILLLDRDTDAVLAAYGGKDDRSFLLVVSYGNGSAAAGAARAFRQAYMPDAQDKSAVKTENGRWTALRASGRYVAVVFDAVSAEAASARLEAVERSIGSLRSPAP